MSVLLQSAGQLDLGVNVSHRERDVAQTVIGGLLVDQRSPSARPPLDKERQRKNLILDLHFGR